ncbi:MAG: L,D-transpeptidase family protein [Micavibrio aeruginosavorus]|uniref:L,D-transpeptidase family protein n=1 Tax=Micavibrio aeruginosavorus TaxID=349221 RepID=A0A7T5UGD1_9BACT|nr:MAG: L,D-transpeptidase family protein [Micavibrio aeruginosavorus]
MAVSAGLMCTAAGYSAMAQGQFTVPGKDMLFAPSLLKQASYGESIALGAVGSQKLSDRDAIQSFYQTREHKPLWTGSRGNADKARAVLSLLQDSWTHGLNPADYHVTEIEAMIQGGGTDETRLELLMTDAVARYGRDMSGIRVNAAAANEHAKFWRQPMPVADVLLRVASSADPKAALEGLAPQNNFYGKLREELIRLSRENAKFDDILPIKLGGRTFYPGDRHQGVKSLRQRLGVEYNSVYGAEELYDDKTAAAVMAFQREHNLDPDGVVGPKTLALLNRSHRDQMEQVIANLERLRWMDEEKPDRYIMVNIPSQTLWAVDQGKVAYEMPVIVGKPERQTKAFRAEIKGIRFNPNWTVPMGIKMKDFLPKLREDPTYLSQKGIEIYQGTGKNRRTIDGTEIDWSSMSSRDMNQLSMVQRQGANNALGRIRVLMPNDFDIYLHDTNTPEYFEKTQRTLSSGCVRLSQPEDIARFVLSRNEGWSDEKMEALLEKGSTVEVSAAEPFPVFIVYQTMWLDRDGRLVYGPDVYKQDQRLIKVLASADDFHIPESSGTRLAEAVDNTVNKF